MPYLALTLCSPMDGMASISFFYYWNFCFCRRRESNRGLSAVFSKLKMFNRSHHRRSRSRRSSRFSTDSPNPAGLNSTENVDVDVVRRRNLNAEFNSSSSAADALTDHTRRGIEQQTTLIRKTTTSTTSRTMSSMRVSFLVSLSTQN